MCIHVIHLVCVCAAFMDIKTLEYCVTAASSCLRPPTTCWLTR